MSIASQVSAFRHVLSAGGAVNLLLTRDQFTPARTLSRLDVDGKAFGFACEDTDRGLDSRMPLDVIKSRKIATKTAIPIGRYRVVWEWSPKHNEFVPWLEDVHGFQAIQIHVGNAESDTDGCILPGMVRSTYVGRSKVACAWLYPRIKEAVASPAGCWIEVRRDTVAWAARCAVVPALGWTP